MLIKAGTYTFNKVLTHGEFSQDINFSTPFTIGGVTGTLNCTRMFNYIPNDNHWVFCYWATTLYNGETLAETYDDEEYVYMYDNVGKSSEWIPHFTRTHTIKEDTEVDDIFGTWYVVNTDYNEVNGIDTDYLIKGSTLKSIASEYRAVLDVPDTFTPEDMKTKVVDAYNKGYEAGAGEGGSSGTPIPIATESEMNTLLENAPVGSVYKYVGETTETYENGGLYTLMETDGVKSLKKLVTPSGVEVITENGIFDVTDKAEVDVNVAQEVTTETKTVTPTEETQIVGATNANYLTRVIVNPIPDEYVKPYGVTRTYLPVDVYTPVKRNEFVEIVERGLYKEIASGVVIRTLKTIKLDDSRICVIYKESIESGVSDRHPIRAVVLKVNGTKVTQGETITIVDDEYIPENDFIYVSEDKIFCIYSSLFNDYVKARILTIDDMTITVGATTTLANEDAVFRVAKLSDNKVMLHISTGRRLEVLSIDGDTISKTASSIYYQSFIVGSSLETQSENCLLSLWGSSPCYAEVITVSGSTISVGNAIELPFKPDEFVAVDDNKSLIFYGGGDAYMLTIDGFTITVGTHSSFNNSIGRVRALGNNEFFNLSPSNYNKEYASVLRLDTETGELTRVSSFYGGVLAYAYGIHRIGGEKDVVIFGDRAIVLYGKYVENVIECTDVTITNSDISSVGGRFVQPATSKSTTKGVCLKKENGVATVYCVEEDGELNADSKIFIDKDDITANGTYIATEYGADGFSSVTVNISSEEQTVTPTTSEQEIKPKNATYLSKVTVEAIPSEYITEEYDGTVVIA